MVGHARAESPNECCGLLVGTAGTIGEAVATTNTERGPTRYRVDPAEHFALVRRLRGTAADIVGAYHSHPRSPAVPSPSDVAEAISPLFLYVIVSLQAAEPDVRAYRIDGTEVREVALSPMPSRIPG